MVVVGSAHVVIRALTDKLQSDIQDGLNKAVGGSRGSGANLGRSFSDSFNSNFNLDIGKSFDGADRDGKRGGAAAGAAAGAGIATGMAAGAAKGSQATVAAAGRAGSGAGAIFGQMFNSSSGGGSRIFISMALRIAALLPILGALVGGISSVVSGLFAMASAANNALYALSPLPGLVGALVQGGAVLMTAFGGVGTALSAGLKATAPAAEDAAKKLDGLKTAARDAAKAVRDAAEAVRDAREGIRDAAEGFQDAKEAVRDAAEGIRDAREAVRDAAKALKDAEEAAAESIVNANEAVADAKERRSEVHEEAAEREQEAIERVKDAEENLTDSHKRVQKAQEALTDARKAAQERLLDLQFATRGGAIAEQRAIMALADAKYKLAATSELPADNRLRQEAQLAYDEAMLNLEMTTERNGDTAESLQEIRDKGIEGTDEVVAAQENLVDAQDNVLDATEAVTEALEDQRDVHKENAEAIRDANEAVKEAKQALDDAYKDAPEMINDAKEALRDANEALRDSKEAARDAREGVADAKEAMSDAQQALADALTALGDAKKGLGQANAEFAAGVPEVNAYQEAMDKLSPPAQRFVEFLLSIRDRMGELRTAAAAGLFPGLQEAIENLVYGPLFPALKDMMFTTGQSIAQAAISISESLTTGVFVGNFRDVVAGNNTTIERMGLVVGDLAAALFAFMSAAQPVTDMLTGWIVKWADGVRVSTELGNANGTLSAKLLDGAESMKQLIRIAANLWEGFSDLGAIADNSGQKLLNSFEKATERFANFTDNKKNVRELREAFDGIADNLRAIGDLALTVGGAFFRLGADPAIGEIAKKLQPVVKTLEDLITGLLDRVGDDLVELVDQILIAFDEISKSGAIEVFLQTMSTAVGAIIAAFQTPVLGDALRLLVKLGAAMYAISILTKFPGIGLIIKALPILATGLRILFGIMTGSPLGLFITALALAAIGLKVLYEKSETFRRIVDTVFGVIKGSLGFVGDAFKAFGDAVTFVFDLIIEGAQFLWDFLFGHSIFPDIQAGFEAFFDVVGDIFTGIATFFTETIPNAAQSLFDWLSENWPLILAILTGPLGLAVLAITENWDTIKEAFRLAKDWVIDVFGNAWGFVKDKIINPIGDAKDKVKELFGEGGPIRSFFSAIKDWVVDKFSSAWSVVKDKILDPIADARDRVRDIFGEGGPVRNFFNGIKDWIINTWSGFWSTIKDKIINPIIDAKDEVARIFGEGGPVRNFFNGIFGWIQDTWQTSWAKIKDTIISPIEGAKDAIVRFFNFEGEGGPIKKAFEAAITGIESIWNGIQNIARIPINFVIREVYNNGLRKAFNLLPGVTLAPADEVGPPSVSKATGGVLPGWSPGKDIHHFVSPTAGRLNLSGGEAIMRPEFTRAVGGEAGVARLNALARRNKLHLPDHGGFFLGGVLPLMGANRVSAHPLPYYGATWAGDLNSPYDLATPPAAVVAWKSGRVAHTYRGYSDGHGRYGNHVIVNHDVGSTLYAHLSSLSASFGSAVAAGQMLGRVGDTGNAYGAHLHFETHGAQVSGGDTGTGGASQPNPGEAEKEGWLDRVKNILEIIPNTYKSVKTMFSADGYYPEIAMASAHTGSDVVKTMNDKIPDTIKVPNFPDIPMPDNPIPNPFSALFDRGGIARGENVWLPKRTARPERVLSPDQTMLFERMVTALERQRDTGGQRGNGDINLNVQVPQQASARDVVDGIVYEMRRYNRGGRYQV